jgi:hypothetical protein
VLCYSVAKGTTEDHHQLSQRNLTVFCYLSLYSLPGCVCYRTKLCLTVIAKGGVSFHFCIASLQDLVTDYEESFLCGLFHTTLSIEIYLCSMR